MGYIEITDRTYRELLSLAAAWRTSVAGALTKLVDDVAADLDHDTLVDPATEVVTVAVFARHADIRTRGAFNPRSRTITVTSGPLTGRRFATPTGAMCAVIEHADCGTRGPGNGWRFWIVTATGDPIHTLRDQPNP